MKIEITIGNGPAEWAHAADTFTAFANLLRGSAAVVSTANFTVNGEIDANALKHIQSLHHAAPGTHSTETSDDNETANTTAPAVDSTGLPWDERIHAKSKGLNADGSWRTRKGVDKSIIPGIEAELRQRTASAAGMYMPSTMTAPQPPMPPQPGPSFAPPASAPPLMPPMTPHAFQQPQPQPGPVEPPYVPPANLAPPAPSAPQPGPAVMDAGTFMNKLGALMQQNTGINAQWLAGICPIIAQESGKPFKEITDVFNDPALVPIAINVLARYQVIVA